MKPLGLSQLICNQGGNLVVILLKN